MTTNIEMINGALATLSGKPNAPADYFDYDGNVVACDYGTYALIADGQLRVLYPDETVVRLDIGVKKISFIPSEAKA